jgi:hypothetical protein
MEGCLMNTYLTSRRLALVAAGGVLAALSLSGVAQAVTDTIFRYTTTKTGYFGIDFMAMAPSNAAAADNYQIGNLTGLTATGVRCFNTGVNLPHGARMTQLVVWTTSGATSNPATAMYRHRLPDGSTDEIVPSYLIVDDSGNRKQTNIPIANNTIAVVRNTGYTYGFAVCLGSGDTFHGARVAYIYFQAGD